MAKVEEPVTDVVENAAPEGECHCARDEAARRMIRNCGLVSIGAGILPLPLVDMLALGGVQVYMIRELAGIYGVPFKDKLARGILSAVAGGVAPMVAFPAVAAFAKYVPVIGTTIGVLAMPGLAAASTVVVGKLIAGHFAKGGTLENVNVTEMKAEYETEVAKEQTKSSGKGGKEAVATA